MTQVVGIDLGTTYSTISYINEAGLPQIIPNAEGKKITPSVVYMQDQEVIIGEEALNYVVLEHSSTVQFVKNQMGKQDYKVPLDNKEYTPAQISSFILKKLKKDAEDYLGTKIKEAIITVLDILNRKAFIKTYIKGYTRLFFHLIRESCRLISTPSQKN